MDDWFIFMKFYGPVIGGFLSSAWCVVVNRKGGA